MNSLSPSRCSPLATAATGSPRSIVAAIFVIVGAFILAVYAASQGVNLEAEPDARRPRRDRRAKPKAGYIELRPRPGWMYNGHAPLRLSPWQVSVFASVTGESLDQLIGPQRVRVPGRTTPRPRSARRRSRTRRSRSRDPDPEPDHPSLSAAAPEREKCAYSAGSDVLALAFARRSAAPGHAG